MEVVTEKRGFEVFGNVDKTKEGKIKSEYPAWYFPQQIDELTESVRRTQDAIDRDMVPLESKAQMKDRIKKEKQKLDEINEGRPKLTEKEIDEIEAVRKSLSKKIGESMYTRSDMTRGTVNAHEEARRLNTPVIKLDEKEISFARNCNVVVYNDGKVTGNGARKTWKIASRLLDLPSDVEILRKA